MEQYYIEMLSSLKVRCKVCYCGRRDPQVGDFDDVMLNIKCLGLFVQDHVLFLFSLIKE